MFEQSKRRGDGGFFNVSGAHGNLVVGSKQVYFAEASHAMEFGGKTLDVRERVPIWFGHGV